ncbi:Isochorismatase-like protein [Pavlovales sp. CCMP2436]|nr:Isochorismatase-like protein [Pavlovales sp. CCMP2436]|mmetsp:Transcript_2147/g.5334  ORF Transcript_2147/g.5334 Transcript_2147/m.5334 type:complete len:456 (-) Transcript_2147:128-1495(-)
MDARSKLAGLRVDARSALLVVDIQADWYSDDPTQLVSSAFPELPHKVAELLDVFRSRLQPVVHVRAKYDCPEASLHMPFFKKLNPEKPGEAISPTPEPWAAELPGELVVLKPTFDGFHETNLHAELQLLGVERVYVCGLVTAACILNTCFGAFRLGYEVVLVGECCADRTRAQHDAVLSIYDGYTFVVADLAELKTFVHDEAGARVVTELVLAGDRSHRTQTDVVISFYADGYTLVAAGVAAITHDNKYGDEPVVAGEPAICVGSSGLPSAMGTGALARAGAPVCRGKGALEPFATPARREKRRTREQKPERARSISKRKGGIPNAARRGDFKNISTGNCSMADASRSWADGKTLASRSWRAQGARWRSDSRAVSPSASAQSPLASRKSVAPGSECIVPGEEHCGSNSRNFKTTAPFACRFVTRSRAHPSNHASPGWLALAGGHTGGGSDEWIEW